MSENNQQIHIWSTLKLGLFAGLIFGCGYWYAGISSTPIKTNIENLEDPQDKLAAYQKVKDRIKLTYFKELTSNPRQVSIGQPVRPPKLDNLQSSDRLAIALEKVLGSGTPNTVSATANAILPEVTGSAFAVQVASFPDRKIAEEFANRLSLKGYDAKLVQSDVPERGTVYRIRIHGFETREAAEQMKAKLALTEKLDAITVAQ